MLTKVPIRKPNAKNGRKKKSRRKKGQASEPAARSLVTVRYDELPADVTAISTILDLYTDEELREIEELILYESLTSTDGVQRCANLVSLVLTNNPLSDHRGIAGLSALESISLGGEAGNLTSLEPLAGLSALRVLEVGSNPVSNIESLQTLLALEDLDLGGTLIDHMRLPQLDRLRKLNVSNCAKLKRIEGIERLPALESFSFYDQWEETGGGIVEITADSLAALEDGIELDIMDDSAHRAFLSTLKVV